MLVAAVLSAIVATSAPSAPADQAIPVAEGPPSSIIMTDYSGTYTVSWRANPDKIHIRYTTRWYNGQIYVCGNVAYSGHSMTSTSRKALRDIYITMDGKEILQDVRFFTVIRSKDKLLGSPAACKATGARPKERGGHTFSIGTSKKRYN